MSDPALATEDPAALRAHALGIAYRMTGGAEEAEDIAQEALARLAGAEGRGVAIATPRAWVATVATRLAIDHLRAARRSRETYLGPWLAEPLVTDPSPGPDAHAELADSLSQSFLMLLERLTPLERAVFVLREVFGHGYAEIAQIVGRGEATCRQVAVRARRHVEEDRARFRADRTRRDELLERFLAACETGDTDALASMLAADVVLYSDGGGKVPAALRPIHGPAKVTRLMVSLARKRAARGARMHAVTVNGGPARLVTSASGDVTDVLALEVAGGLVQAVHIVRNPDKLRHVAERSGLAPPRARGPRDRGLRPPGRSASAAAGGSAP